MIGHWARRIHFGLGSPVPRTKWHLIDSEITRNAGLVYVMRCGREMVTKRDLPWEFTTLIGGILDRPCSQCHGASAGLLP